MADTDQWGNWTGRCPICDTGHDGHLPGTTEAAAVCQRNQDLILAAGGQLFTDVPTSP